MCNILKKLFGCTAKNVSAGNANIVASCWRLLADIPKNFPLDRKQILVCKDETITLRKNGSLPEKLQKGEVCWIITSDNITLSVKLQYGTQQVTATTVVRFETDTMLANYTANLVEENCYSITDEMLSKIVVTQLRNVFSEELQPEQLLKNYTDTNPDAVTQIRAGLSLHLREYGIRCLSLENVCVKPIPFDNERNGSVKLRLVEANYTPVYIVGGDKLTFGRNNPYASLLSDISLKIMPVTNDEIEKQAEFEIINRLFSRNHAQLEFDKNGDIYLTDIRQSGITDATILDGQPLSRGESVLMFQKGTNAETQAVTRTVLFSKMLAFQFTAYTNTTDSVAVSIKCVEYYQQKPFAESLITTLQSQATSLGESTWWKNWLNNETNRDPRFQQVEHVFVPTSTTLSADSAPINLHSRRWNGATFSVRLIGKTFYIENTSTDSNIKLSFYDHKQKLLPSYPVPIRSGVTISNGETELRFLD